MIINNNITNKRIIYDTASYPLTQAAQLTLEFTQKDAYKYAS